MGREVALKVLHGELARRPERRRAVSPRSGRARAACAIRTRSRCTTSAQSADGTRYIVMELLRGESLHELFHAQGRAAVAARRRDRARRVQLAARGARARHRSSRSQAGEHPPRAARARARLREGPRLRHREDARRRATLAAPSSRSPVSSIGTFDYMSPEQLLGGSCTGRSDVFALGVVIVRDDRGPASVRRDAKGPASMLMALLGTEPAPLVDRRRRRSARARSVIVMRALAHDPERTPRHQRPRRHARAHPRRGSRPRARHHGRSSRCEHAGVSRSTSRANDREANDRDADRGMVSRRRRGHVDRPASTPRHADLASDAHRDAGADADAAARRAAGSRGARAVANAGLAGSAQDATGAERRRRAHEARRLERESRADRTSREADCRRYRRRTRNPCGARRCAARRRWGVRAMRHPRASRPRAARRRSLRAA